MPGLLICPPGLAFWKQALLARSVSYGFHENKGALSFAGSYVTHETCAQTRLNAPLKRDQVPVNGFNHEAPSPPYPDVRIKGQAGNPPRPNSRTRISEFQQPAPPPLPAFSGE